MGEVEKALENGLGEILHLSQDEIHCIALNDGLVLRLRIVIHALIREISCSNGFDYNPSS